MAERSEQERDEALFPTLDEPTARLLFPERFPGPLQVTLVYPPLEGAAAERAAAALEAATVEQTTDPTLPGEPERQAATFAVQQVEPLHKLYQIVRETFGDSGVEVKIDGRRLPQGLVRDLWLPLLWCLRS